MFTFAAFRFFPSSCVALFAFFAVVSSSLVLAAEPKVRLNEADYRDRILACWIGKNIGGTLGMPVEGRHGPHDLTFYTNLKKGEAAPNDDIDLQVLWLKALEDHGGRVDARILGDYWLKYVPVDWNEYGVCKKNMRLGLLPPLSGEWDNARWKHSNGAFVRSEIWACLYPGLPALAARMAREDACVDHGAGEGTLAAIFMATLESAAFVERDREKLLDFGLAAIPPGGGVARAIRAVTHARRAGKDWKEARAAVIEASKETGWFQAPRNIGFVVIGWLYGDGDFGKSICTAVNCGDDTDSTGATVGSMMALIGGTEAIPAKWREPIGDAIKPVATSGFKAFATVQEFTDHTVAMAKKVLAEQADGAVAIGDGPADLAGAKELLAHSLDPIRQLCRFSPYHIFWREDDLHVILTYGGDPVVEPGKEILCFLTVEPQKGMPPNLEVQVAGAPEDWVASVGIGSGARGAAAYGLRVVPSKTATGTNRMTIRVTGGEKPIEIPFTLIVQEPPPKVGDDDLALASKGAVATSDSELAREPGCTPKVIDGRLCGPEDFEANRWHSSIETPHPHWVQVKLPKAAAIGRVVIRFADPAGYAVKFRGLVATPDGKGWTEVFRREDNKESRTFRAEFAPVVTDTFRLVIEKSANPGWPNAAQVSEIEVYAK